MPDFRALVSILEEAKALVGLPGNDFAWSFWADAAQAVEDIDSAIEAIRNGVEGAREQIAFLFLPTGPLQALSLSSGWSAEFLELADRCDRALG